MLLPSIFGNDFFEDFMNFPTWDRTTRDANHQLERRRPAAAARQPRSFFGANVTAALPCIA